MAVEVSIIVCAYNRARLLARGLRSLLAQDFPPERLEIILVDDGSTDDTPEVARQAASALPPGHLRYVALSKPAGLYRSPARARNVGLWAARGWLVILTDPEIVAGRRAVSMHYALHRDSPVELVATTAPWMVSPEGTAAPGTLDGDDDVAALRRKLRPTDVTRDDAKGPHFDAHFASFKRYWAYANGGVNERYESWGFESTDFCRRLHWHGLRHVQDVGAEAEVCHLWHDRPPGCDDARMREIEDFLNCGDRNFVVNALRPHGIDLRGLGGAEAYAAAREALLRMTPVELARVLLGTVPQQGPFADRITRFRLHRPGDPIYDLEPWIGLRHLTDWDDWTTALAWIDLARRDWPADDGLRLEQAKLLLKLGRVEEVEQLLTNA
jgi:GT2 family glycosyltransferase